MQKKFLRIFICFWLSTHTSMFMFQTVANATHENKLFDDLMSKRNKLKKMPYTHPQEHELTSGEKEQLALNLKYTNGVSILQRNCHNFILKALEHPNVEAWIRLSFVREENGHTCVHEGYFDVRGWKSHPEQVTMPSFDYPHCPYPSRENYDYDGAKILIQQAEQTYNDYLVLKKKFPRAESPLMTEKEREYAQFGVRLPPVNAAETSDSEEEAPASTALPAKKDPPKAPQKRDRDADS
ncbi:MAG: hypothetical protein WCK49_09765 [Myxococcaceae bacterium]